MIDTIVLRLHGINDIKTENLDVLAQQNSGLTPFLVPEHQALFRKMLEYKGKYFKMDRVFKRNTKEYSILNDDDYLNNKLGSDRSLTLDYMEFVDADNTKQIPLSVRGKLDVVEEKNSGIKSIDNINSYSDSEIKEIDSHAKGKFRTPSSINYVQFRLNPNGQFIEFEFSIPKYLYGHNLAEFIPQGGSDLIYEKGRKFDFRKWGTQSKFLYDRLFDFVEQFFTDLCIRFKLEALPNMNYVEIRRIDLCYNQYFDSKEEALRTLDQQKKLNSKKHRKNQKKIGGNIYDSSLSYLSSSGSYFKIYHKGTEYAKSEGDLQKHLKINKQYLHNKFKKFKPENEKQISFKELYFENKNLLEQIFHDHTKGIKIVLPEQKIKEIRPLYEKTSIDLPYDTKFLKNEMDKVLRYEVSLSINFFKYHYKNKIFRKNDIHHQKALETYKKIKNIYDSRTNLDDDKIFKSEHDTHKMMHKYLNRAISLVMSKNNKINIFENKSLDKRIQLFDYDVEKGIYRIGRVNYPKSALSQKDVGLFSPEMLTSCVNHFRYLMKQFEVKSLEPTESISDKIKSYNLTAKKNLLLYNERNNHLCFGMNNKRKVKGGKKIQEQCKYLIESEIIKYGYSFITKASELLTESQKAKLHLQQINPAPLIGILNGLNSGLSMEQYFTKHHFSSSAKSRYRKQLANFEIFEKTLITEIPIKQNWDFTTYYWNTGIIKFKNKFYFHRNDYLKNIKNEAKNRGN